MAIGDCKDFACGSPLDFDSLLSSLFAKFTDGCIGLKTVWQISACADLTSAVTCAQDMTLEEIVTRSIVDDGAGGNALSVVLLSDPATCEDDCGVYLDLETLIKSMFSQTSNGCFALRLWPYSGGCENLDGYDQCSALLTAEQVFRNSLWTDACGNLTLGVYQGTYTECTDFGCDLYASFEFAVKELFRTYNAAHCGAFMLNYGSVGLNTLTDLRECGLHLTFEDAFRAAITVGDCGPGFTVWSLTRGEQQ